MANELDIAHEFLEAQAEIARHHRDFTKISELIDRALDTCGMKYGRFAPIDPSTLKKTLKEIRNIVG